MRKTQVYWIVILFVCAPSFYARVKIFTEVYRINQYLPIDLNTHKPQTTLAPTLLMLEKNATEIYWSRQ